MSNCLYAQSCKCKQLMHIHCITGCWNFVSIPLLQGWGVVSGLYMFGMLADGGAAACLGLSTSRISAWLIDATAAQVSAVLNSVGAKLCDGRVVANNCLQQLDHPTNPHCAALSPCCSNCASLWVKKPSCRTQGTGKGPLQCKLCNIRNRQSADSKAEYQLRRLHERRSSSRAHNRTKTRLEAVDTNMSADCKELCTFLTHLDRKGCLTASFLTSLQEHASNGWRQGKDVHGKRYAQSSPYLDAAAHMQLKQQASTGRMLVANGLASIPCAVTSKRRSAADSSIEIKTGFQSGASLAAQCSTMTFSSGRYGSIQCV